jgi:hypothetical protein
MGAERRDDGRLVNVWTRVIAGRHEVVVSTRDPAHPERVRYETGEFGEVVRVVLRFAEVDGRLVCANVEVGADFDNPDEPDPVPITTGVWRKVNVSRLIDEALLQAVKSLPAMSKFERSGEAARRRLAKVEATLEGKRVGRPPRWTRDELEEAARVYRQHSGGRSPRKAVAKHFNLSDSGAAKVIARARQEHPDLFEE